MTSAYKWEIAKKMCGDLRAYKDPKDGEFHKDRRSCPIYGCRESELAAKLAVREVFAILGVDIDHPEQVNKFRKGINFGQDLQKFANRGIITFVVVVATLAAGSLFLGIAYKLKLFIEK
jgi:hypothetical protein